MALLGARALGANVPDLLHYLIQADSTDAWAQYASLGAEEGRYVIRTSGELALKISYVLLRICPEDILPLLLAVAVGDRRALHSTPEHPLRRVEDWIKSPANTSGERMRRASSLLTSVELWWRQRGSENPDIGDVAIHTLCIAFDPDWQDVESDPGSGRTLTISHGAIGEQEIRGLHSLWRKYRHLLTFGQHYAWKNLVSLVYEWRRGPPNVRLTDSMIALRRKISKEILQDLARASSAHIAVQHQIRAVGHNLRFKIDTAPNDEFDVLFPFRENSVKWREEHARWLRNATALAPLWVQVGPDLSASKIAQFESEARQMEITWPRLSHALFNEIASTVPNLLAWFNALTKAGAPADLVQPFLRSMIESAQKGAFEQLRQCLNSPDYALLATGEILRRSSLPPEIVDLAFQKAEAFPEQLETWCLRGELPIEHLERALSVDNTTTVLAAAIGEWTSAKHEKRVVRSPTIWRKAVLRSATPGGRDLLHNRDYWLADIFKEDSTVAFEWLAILYAIPCDYHDYVISKLAGKALRTLLPNQSIALLNRLNRSAAAYISVSALVGDDATVYAALLARSDLADIHLRTLEGTPSPGWRVKAIAALDAGYTKAQVLEATRLRSWEWTGNRSDMWKERKKAFEPYAVDSDARIASIVGDVLEELDRRINEDLKEEHEEAVYGRDRRRR